MGQNVSISVAESKDDSSVFSDDQKDPGADCDFTLVPLLLQRLTFFKAFILSIR